MMRVGPNGEFFEALGLNNFESDCIIFPLAKLDEDKAKASSRIAEWIFEGAEYVWRFAAIGDEESILTMSQDQRCIAPRIDPEKFDYTLALQSSEKIRSKVQ